ncbi:MAG: hypothetical protein ACREPX_01540 [Rhodanobacteraceae bacterium]
MLATVASAGLLFAAAGFAQSTVVTFDNGGEGWDGNGSIEETGGNPGANAHFLIENFGIEYRTDSNAAFIGDLTPAPSATVGIDALVNSITFEGNEVSRNLIVEFRSRALAVDGYPWTSVWFNLGVLQAGTEWGKFSVTFTPDSAVLPAGWGGYGAEDPNTFEPILPEGITFADVMASVDEVAFTTYEPGWFFGFTIFDVRIDNLRIDRAEGNDTVFVDGFDGP